LGCPSGGKDRFAQASESPVGSGELAVDPKCALPNALDTLLIVKNITLQMTNAQWAWEYLRRNPTYRGSYRAWCEAFDDEGELSTAERDQINAALELLGPWKPRYAPWVRAGLETGRPFIHRREVSHAQMQGQYFEAKLHLDPMAFLLTEWLDPAKPIPADLQPFDHAGSLDLAIVDEHSAEFQAALQLGLLNVFVPTQRSGTLPGAPKLEPAKLADLISSRKLDQFLPGEVVGYTPMYGWPRPPFSDELDLMSESPDFAQAREHDWKLRETLGSPKAIYHSVQQLLGPNGLERVDRHFNIQFDLTLPLDAQLAAAQEILASQQQKLDALIHKEVPLAGEIEVSNVLSTYERGLQLLDAYDALEGTPVHGRIAQAIRIVLDDPMIKSKESEYERLVKAYHRADMLREVGYRSLAFLKDTNRQSTITAGT
jgi:hypothetical protein